MGWKPFLAFPRPSDVVMEHPFTLQRSVRHEFMLCSFTWSESGSYFDRITKQAPHPPALLKSEKRITTHIRLYQGHIESLGLFLKKTVSTKEKERVCLFAFTTSELDTLERSVESQEVE